MLIKNGKIKEVGEDLSASFGEEFIDAMGGWILPGLVETHSHLGTHEANMGFEGNDTSEITDQSHFNCGSSLASTTFKMKPL